MYKGCMGLTGGRCILGQSRMACICACKVHDVMIWLADAFYLFGGNEGFSYGAYASPSDQSWSVMHFANSLLQACETAELDALRGELAATVRKAMAAVSAKEAAEARTAQAETARQEAETARNEADRLRREAEVRHREGVWIQQTSNGG